MEQLAKAAAALARRFSQRPLVALAAVLAHRGSDLVLVPLTGAPEGEPPWRINDEAVVGRCHADTGPVDIDLSNYADGAALSRRHARLLPRDGLWWVEDLGSKNGTTVDGAAVAGRRLLTDGARLCWGTICFELRLHDRNGRPGTDACHFTQEHRAAP
jgi:hypothetical protein